MPGLRFLTLLALSATTCIGLSSAAVTPPTFDANFKFDKDVDNYKLLPKRSQLPTIPGQPAGAAWFWGPDDGLGRLNFQTAKRVQRALKETKTGDFAALNAPVYEVANPAFYNRPPVEHHFTNFSDGTLAINDEHIEFNTQTSSHIDGFRHYGHLESRIFYNGCTQDDIIGPNANLKCGIGAWAEKGIAGRGILLDVERYAKLSGQPNPILTPHNITFDYLKKVARSQKLDLRRSSEGGDIEIGDVLLVRTGFFSAYQKLTQEERLALSKESPEVGWIGLQPSEDMLDFLHDSYFSAVVADNPSMEASPFPVGAMSLHEYLLPLWGVPIGELWDLEKLSEICEKKGGWKFLVTSAPFNMDGNVASWANAIAIV